MKLSRRGFMGKSVKALAIAAVAPILPIAVTKSITANSVPDVTVKEYGTGKEVKLSQVYKNSCTDFSTKITIQDYKPGQTISYQELSVDPSCGTCQHAHACTENGKKFDKETILDKIL